MLEEIYYCVKHIGLSYSDVMGMSVYERRNYLSLLLNENTKKTEMIEEQNQNMKSSNGSRTTKVSGEALKAKLKSGQIPNE